MRVLFVSPVIPWPLRSGGRIRTYELLRAVRAHAEVHVRAVEDPGPLPEGLRAVRAACASFASFPRTGVVGAERLRLPKLARWFHSRPLTEAVQRELAHGAYDVVHLDEMFLAGALEAPTAIATSVPTVVHHHKLDLEFARATGASAYDALKLKRLERTACRRFRHHVLCSREDALRLEARHPGLATRVIPNGVDLERYWPYGEARKPRRLLFLGSLDYGPNLDAVEHLVRDVLPEVRGDWHLDIVGARPHPALGWLGGERVRVVGEVDDVRPWLGRASALVVPLRIGGGSRLKIAEALAMGCPVISTGVGAEGLDLEDGVHLTLAGPGSRFAAAIDAVLDDPNSAAARAANGRARIVERYGWSSLARELYAAWESACALSSSR